MTHNQQTAVLWVLGGLVYYPMEGLFHIITNGGWAWVGMVVIGGLCFVLVGAMNQRRWFYTAPMWYQCLAGTIVILLVEFVSGCILNLWLGLRIWDYSRLPLNVCGQICLPFAALWFLLVPVAVWLEDQLRARLWHEGKRYTLGSIYRELFTGR